jgi:hypothetical protein
MMVVVVHADHLCKSSIQTLVKCIYIFVNIFFAGTTSEYIFCWDHPEEIPKEVRDKNNTD